MDDKGTYTIILVRKTHFDGSRFNPFEETCKYTQKHVQKQNL